MVELVLEQDIELSTGQAPPQVSRDIVGQVLDVRPPGQRDDLDLIALLTQMLDEHTVIQVSPGEGI
jgi:hypothetical protein